MDERQKANQQEQEEFLLSCDGCLFSISKKVDDGLEILAEDDSKYLLSTKSTNDQDLLKCKFANQSLHQYLDLNQKLDDRGVFDFRFTTMKRPSDELRDISNGVLKLVLDRDWTGYSYRKLGNPKVYGLEWVDSFYETDWDPRIRVHLPMGSFSSDDISVETIQSRKGKVLCLFDQLFVGRTDPNHAPLPTSEYPIFFHHWHRMMLEWVSDPNYPHTDILMNHPTYWSSSYRLHYFLTVYRLYESDGGRTKAAIEEAFKELKSTWHTSEESWSSKIQRCRPLARCYTEQSYDNVYLFVMGALRHLHAKLRETVPIPDKADNYQEYYKYISFDDMNTWLKPLKVEEAITVLFPDLLPILATTLFKKGIH